MRRIDRLEYTLRRTRRRTIGLLIRDGQLIVNAPSWVSVRHIDAVVQEKQGWILKKQDEWQKRQRCAPLMQWTHGARIPFLGDELLLHLDPDHLAVTLSNQVLTLPLCPSSPPQEVSFHVELWLKQQAQFLFAERLASTCDRAGLSLGRWRLSSARTRWGSCSANGDLRVNWRLIHLPLHLIDYVIAHEVAHRHELNHSARFWCWVATLFPEFEEAEKALKKISLAELVHPTRFDKPRTA